jgi:hypothetical protein
MLVLLVFLVFITANLKAIKKKGIVLREMRDAKW